MIQLNKTPRHAGLIKRFGIVFTLLLQLTAGSGAQAYSRQHAPFAPGEAPVWGTLPSCIEIGSRPTEAERELHGDVRVHAVPDAPVAPVLHMHDHGITRNWDITIKNRNNEILSTPITLHSSPLPPEVFHADFNQDGAVDFLVAGGNMGNGLAASITYTAFFLSKDERYSSVYFQGYDFSSKDVIRMKKNGPWYYIYCDLVSSYGEKTRDGNLHNFWVYQLFRFEGARMVETVDVAPFPKWVWYTENENHKETRQLNTDQKKRILDRERSERETVGIFSE